MWSAEAQIHVVHERFVFDDRTDAYSEYIVCEIQSIARSTNLNARHPIWTMAELIKLALK